MLLTVQLGLAWSQSQAKPVKSQAKPSQTISAWRFKSNQTKPSREADGTDGADGANDHVTCNFHQNYTVNFVIPARLCVRNVTQIE